MRERKYNFNPQRNFKGVEFVRPWHHSIKGSDVREQHAIDGAVFRHGGGFNSPVVAVALPHKDGGVMLYVSPLCKELGGMQVQGDVFRFVAEDWRCYRFSSLCGVRKYLRNAFKGGAEQ